MIIANFKNNEIVKDVAGLWQYNYGETLRIQGLDLPTAVEVHFSLQEKGGESVTRVGTTRDGVTDVVIPDSMLEANDTTMDYCIYAFIYLTTETSGETYKEIVMRVRTRPKPEAFDTPEEAELFREAIAAVNECADRAEAAEQNASTEANHAELSKEEALKAQAAAENAQTASETAKSAAEESKAIAETAKEEAITAATEAQSYATASEQSATASAIAREEAQTFANQAEQSATKAEEMAGIAETAKDTVLLAQKAVEHDKETVAQESEDFIRKKEAAMQEISTVKESGITEINKATEDGVKTIQVTQSSAEASIEAKVAEIEADREQINNNKNNIDELKSDLAANKQAVKELSDKKITKFYANNLGATNMQDSDSGKIQDMMIFGKSEQFSGEIEMEDGTTVTVPCPDYPQEIMSVVSPIVNVSGRNLIPNRYTKYDASQHNTERIRVCPNTSYDVSFVNVIKNFLYVTQYDKNRKIIKNELIQINPGKDGRCHKVIQTMDNCWYLQYRMWTNGKDENANKIKPQLAVGNESIPYEPYIEPQIASLHYTLNAIPVSSGGNVTIDGQKYIADYVDIENNQIHRLVDLSKLDPTVSIIDNTDLLLSQEEVIDLTAEEVQAFKDLATYYPTTNVMVTSDQLDGYTTFNYPLSMENGWNIIKEQLGDTREYIYDMELQSAEAYVNSEYAVALAELEV